MGLLNWLRGKDFDAEEPIETAQGPSTGEGGSTPLPEEVLWLADAPLFIDDVQVEAFYDAILRPDYEETSATLTDELTRSTTFGAEITVGAAIPWFTKGEATGNAERSRERVSGKEVSLNRITNPHRHLLALVLHYASRPELRSRLLVAGADGVVDAEGRPIELDNKALAMGLPRALVLLDLPPETSIIPTALELDGGTVTVYKGLEESLKPDGDPGPIDFDSDDPASRLVYWKWFRDNYDDRKALVAVEKAVKEKQIAWINYRVEYDDFFPHLNLKGRGAYDTGTFAYNFIARGHRHGLRIVGTLKSEPGLNVLAVFER